jgi:hypothetical protein
VEVPGFDCQHHKNKNKQTLKKKGIKHVSPEYIQGVNNSREVKGEKD